MAPTFGLFLSSNPEGDPVGQARRAETLGFDMVTVSDHLHGLSGSVETWTLLTWIAAATERIRVAPNVLALPYRNPGVVAKMAASLDQLSGGRLVLGLGAGGNDAAFRAFGLAGREPGEKVAALEEAVDVMQGLWSEPGFTYEGRHFRTERANLEPRPERRIPIWLGVYGERMVDLAGRKADGWLPSLFFMPPERAYERMERLRTAAAGAGRDPGDLAHAYNVWLRVEEGAEPKKGQVAGGPKVVAEALAGFLQGGFTHLNFAPDGDPVEQAERLAQEVIPALRGAAG